MNVARTELAISRRQAPLHAARACDDGCLARRKRQMLCERAHVCEVAAGRCLDDRAHAGGRPAGSGNQGATPVTGAEEFYSEFTKSIDTPCAATRRWFSEQKKEDLYDITRKKRRRATVALRIDTAMAVR